MTKQLLRSVLEASTIADKIQGDNPGMTRIDAVKQAMFIQKQKEASN
jgi:hypothetical protein